MGCYSVYCYGERLYGLRKSSGYIYVYVGEEIVRNTMIGGDIIVVVVMIDAARENYVT